MIYYSSKEPFAFKTFKIIKSFGENIYSGKITISEANEEQVDLINDVLNFISKARPKSKDDENVLNFSKKRNVLNTAKNLLKVEN